MDKLPLSRDGDDTEYTRFTLGIGIWSGGSGPYAQINDCQNHPDTPPTRLVIQPTDVAVFVHGECDACETVSYWSDPDSGVLIVEIMGDAIDRQDDNKVQTADGHYVTEGDRVWNYYDGWWGTVGKIDGDGWFNCAEIDGPHSALLNGERISQPTPCQCRICTHNRDARRLGWGRIYEPCERSR